MTRSILRAIGPIRRRILTIALALLLLLLKLLTVLLVLLPPLLTVRPIGLTLAGRPILLRALRLRSLLLLTVLLAVLSGGSLRRRLRTLALGRRRGTFRARLGAFPLGRRLGSLTLSRRLGAFTLRPFLLRTLLARSAAALRRLAAARAPLLGSALREDDPVRRRASLEPEGETRQNRAGEEDQSQQPHRSLVGDRADPNPRRDFWFPIRPRTCVRA